MTAYLQGDTPAAPVLLSPTRDGRTVDLAPFDAVTAELLTGAGILAATAQLVDDPDEGRVISVLLPGPLEVPGLLWLRLTLTTTAGGSERFTSPVVVEQLNGWHTLATARAEWPDAAELDDARLYVLLETSRNECAAYAPALPAGEFPPVNYREAQLMHARNRAAASRVDPANGDAGGDGYGLTVFPLDWAVRQTLRPMRGYKGVR